MDQTRFCMYDISLTHPKDWTIYSNPQKILAFTQGMLKIEKLDKQPTDISLSLKWFTLNDFDPARYPEALHESLKKKFKRKLHDFNHQAINLLGHEAVLMSFGYADNHSIYKVLRNDEQVAEMQLMLPCPVTGRVIIANVAAMADNMQQQHALFREMLMGIGCHVE